MISFEETLGRELAALMYSKFPDKKFACVLVFRADGGKVSYIANGRNDELTMNLLAAAIEMIADKEHQEVADNWRQAREPS